MATWIIGDIHGCAEELHELLERIAPGPEDTIVSCGDLLHRGPDPAGVCDLLEGVNARFVLGNHERAVLRRLGIAPTTVDGSDGGVVDSDMPELEPEDLAGDGRTKCLARPDECLRIVEYLQKHSGFLLRNSGLEHAGPTRDGRGWLVVHAGFDPKNPPESQDVGVLCSIRRLPKRRKPYWYERYDGPDLVLFGHTHSPLPRIETRGKRRIAIGLDTGCCYGGSLTAYSPELDEFETVQAASRGLRAA